MLKTVLILSLLTLLSHARENPFFPASGDKDLYITSNKVDRVDNLKRLSTTFPDSARILKEVTIKYQNLDGSIESKTLMVDQAVDWHLPLFISQTFLDSKAPKEKHTETVNKIVSTKIQRLNFNFIDFDVRDNIIYVKTTDKLIRHFIMTKPHRIVMDYKRDASFRTKTKSVKNAKVEKVTLGNHNGYYRSVIYLDGQYKYRLKKSQNAVTITLL